MNIQRIFEAVKNEPDQETIIIIVNELEKQGYLVIINDKYNGSKNLLEAEARNELCFLPYINGIKIKIFKKDEVQNFRVHYLDNDAIALTELESLPIEYNNGYTVNLLTKN